MWKHEEMLSRTLWVRVIMHRRQSGMSGPAQLFRVQEGQHEERCLSGMFPNITPQTLRRYFSTTLSNGSPEWLQGRASFLSSLISRFNKGSSWQSSLVIVSSNRWHQPYEFFTLSSLYPLYLFISIRCIISVVILANICSPARSLASYVFIWYWAHHQVEMVQADCWRNWRSWRSLARLGGWQTLGRLAKVDEAWQKVSECWRNGWVLRRADGWRSPCASSPMTALLFSF